MLFQMFLVFTKTVTVQRNCRILIKEAFEAVTGRKFRVDFEVGEVAAKNEQVQPVASRRQVMRELQQDPVLQKAIEEFDGEIIDFQKRKPK